MATVNETVNETVSETDNNTAPPPGKIWLLRPGRLLDLGVIIALVAATAGLYSWRQGQFSGHGLRAVYYPGRSLDGKPFRTGVERYIDFSNKTHEHFKRNVFSAEWTGTIYLPRSGRYGFATESDDGSMLEIDGQVVVNNGGIHALRRRQGVRILKQGVHRFRVHYFQAGQGGSVRVFWSPAGRRGGLEYIPPTLLFPRSPQEVDPATARAVPPRDFPVIVGLGLCLFLTLLVLLRSPLLRWLARLRDEPAARLDLALFVLLFAVGLVVRLWDKSASGQTWDEDVYWASGRNFMQNLLAGDFRAESWVWNSEHPALAKWIYGPAALHSESFEPARLVSLILGASTCALLYLVGRDLISRRVGFLGAGLSLVMPHILGHHKIIGLETPTALLYTLVIWLFYRAVKRGGNSPLYLVTGICVGLAAATRISNLSVLAVPLVLYLLANRREIVHQRRFPVPLYLGLLPLAAAVAFIGLWPYLWENPLRHMGLMLSHWEPDKFLEWFLGKKQLPHWYYFPLYFSVTMPVGALGALALFFGRFIQVRDRAHLYLLLWFLAPFVVMLSPLARDGVRYLYPSLFAACLLMAAGLDWLSLGVARLARRGAVQRPVLAVLGTAMGLYVFYCGSTVHPYYLDYYNELTGGPAKVAKGHVFEIGWWGEGLKEANDYISEHAPRGAKVMIYAHPAHVVRLRPDLRQVSFVPQADYIIFNDLFNNRPKSDKHHVTYVVRAAGAPLAWVYARDGIGASKE